ncbi:hypothetical protein [Pseudonocardia parietis]|uniref:Phosphotransferase family enzyme n=1 Tax=Pseudonocardia parietis TaxID=570936 RepID=A0ABS4VKI2_9PSEU|nr:hypothetical protein [Pseudonocardia parietis]MBP2364431.1 hypothetical protein [Pseudonocardia parietis]
MLPVPPRLTPKQRTFLDAWLPGAEFVRDRSWGLIGTTVLQLRCAGQDLIVKAGDDADTHIARELRAHREWLGPLHGRVPELVHADDEAKVLVTRYLPGVLVERDPAENHPDTYWQAGRLLARLHGQYAAVDDRYEARMRDRAWKHLAGPHSIDPDTEARLRAEIVSWPDGPA